MLILCSYKYCNSVFVQKGNREGNRNTLTRQVSIKYKLNLFGNIEKLFTSCLSVTDMLLVFGWCQPHEARLHSLLS